ncbi:type II toxin-antitoxin system Phd/YefM family antitoxin [Acidisoma silvae]|uniref:Type II toxin-antitoxin system prevent-host-death family antitoxin n=1 Tax=Acidisoma silvae TaxID=2802396 RepID=A0A963YSP1_9PROT|nr:type II toxin-antitoxin system prevent-host-death family antitoxin [Acidisoma silvae]MCB8876349.1 type II toxin-antitoxin system prevent-host-death family antitoxin [Acidisoma silvae]
MTMDSFAEITGSEQIQDLLTRVEQGEAVTITRDGKPVARLVPLPPPFDRDKAKAAADGLREMSKGVRLNGLTIRELIDEGRRY